MGQKVKGKRRRIIKVQPTAVARSRANGTKRRGRRSLGSSAGRIKERSGESAIFVMSDGEEMEFPSLAKPKSRKKSQPHNFQKAVNESNTLPRRHTRQ